MHGMCVCVCVCVRRERNVKNMKLNISWINTTVSSLHRRLTGSEPWDRTASKCALFRSNRTHRCAELNFWASLSVWLLAAIFAKNRQPAVSGGWRSKHDFGSPVRSFLGNKWRKPLKRINRKGATWRADQDVLNGPVLAFSPHRNRSVVPFLSGSLEK